MVILKIRLCGLPEDVEAATRELRRSFDVVAESSDYASKEK